MKTQTAIFAVQTDEHNVIQSIGISVINQPKTRFKGEPMKWYDDSLLVLYIYVEEDEPIIKTKKAWLEWFEQYGDKDNFENAELWFDEMLHMQILNKYRRVSK